MNTSKMLKEFLRDDDSNSSSSSAFKSLPPRNSTDESPTKSTVYTLLRRSLHLISLSSTSSPGSLPRSLSKRLLMIGFRWPVKKKTTRRRDGKVKVKVKVKDILRWRSFRDFAENDETLDELRCGCVHGNTVDDDGRDFLIEEMEEQTLDSHQVGPEDQITSEDDKEQHSPVSILDSPFRDETLEQELVVSSFNQSLANVERTKHRLLQSIQWFESLAGLDDESSLGEDEKDNEEFEDEEERKEDDELVSEKGKSKTYLSNVFCWVRKGKQGLKDKEECIKDMERQKQWGSYKFGEEREELGVEIDVALLNELVDEILVDLFV